MPALLTSTSIRPNRFMAARIIAVTDDGEVTSVATASAGYKFTRELAPAERPAP